MSQLIRHSATRLAVACIGGCLAVVVWSCETEDAASLDSSHTESSFIAALDLDDEYCGDPDALPPPMVLEASTASGDYRVRLIDIPNPVPSHRIFPLRIEVQSNGTVLPDDLLIRADAAMPHHGHGMTVEPVVRRLDSTPAVFDVSGMMFHMPGEWEVYIDIVDGPYSERVTFNAFAR